MINKRRWIISRPGGGSVNFERKVSEVDQRATNSDLTGCCFSARKSESADIFRVNVAWQVMKSTFGR